MPRRYTGEKVSVFNPIEQRVYGLAHILDGIGQIIMGKHWPYGLALEYAMHGARKASERAKRGKRRTY